MLTRTGHPFGWLLSVLREEGSDKSVISEALVSAVSELGHLDAAHASQVRQALLYFIQQKRVRFFRGVVSFLKEGMEPETSEAMKEETDGSV